MIYSVPQGLAVTMAMAMAMHMPCSVLQDNADDVFAGSHQTEECYFATITKNGR